MASGHTTSSTSTLSATSLSSETSSTSSSSVLSVASAGSLSGAVFVVPPNRRKRSLLWRYFTKLNEKEARCDECGMKIATAGNTTNMMKVSTH